MCLHLFETAAQVLALDEPLQMSVEFPPSKRITVHAPFEGQSVGSPNFYLGRCRTYVSTSRICSPFNCTGLFERTTVATTERCDRWCSKLLSRRCRMPSVRRWSFLTRNCAPLPQQRMRANVQASGLIRGSLKSGTSEPVIGTQWVAVSGTIGTCVDYNLKQCSG